MENLNGDYGERDICPICAAKSVLVATKTRQSEETLVFLCDDCDLAFLDRAKADRDERHFYNEIYPVDVNPENLGTSPQSVNDWRLDFSKPYLTNDQSVIEIGSAAGEFLSMVEPHVNSVVGCDLNSAQCVRAEKNYGIKSYNADIREIDSAVMFDVVFMFQIFEHVWTPHDFLITLNQKLNQNGLIILDIPNLKDALYRLYELPFIKEKFYFKEQHPMNYSVKALNKVMKMNGFEEVETRLVQDYSITNHLNWIYTNKGNKSFEEGMSAQLDQIPNPEYKEVWDKLDQHYRELLTERGYSDTIFAIFRKSQD